MTKPPVKRIHYIISIGYSRYQVDVETFQRILDIVRDSIVVPFVNSKLLQAKARTVVKIVESPVKRHEAYLETSYFLRDKPILRIGTVRHYKILNGRVIIDEYNVVHFTLMHFDPDIARGLSSIITYLTKILLMILPLIDRKRCIYVEIVGKA